MQRLKVKELVREAHAAVPGLPPATAGLMREMATRLDVTFTALIELMDQRGALMAEIECLRDGSSVSEVRE